MTLHDAALVSSDVGRIGRRVESGSKEGHGLEGVLDEADVLYT